MPCGWEGNCGSSIALSMRHRLQWFILHLRAYGPRKGDKHPAYTPHRVWHSFTFPLCVAGSMKRSCALAWAHSSKPAAAGWLLWARQAGDTDRLVQQRCENAGSATLLAYVGS